jgi:hypothetical protein
MIETLFASLPGVEPSGRAQAVTFAGSFLLAGVGITIMWLRTRR